MAKLAEHIRQEIRSRYCTPEMAGVRLPAERELVRHFGVSRVTVRDAMSDLVASGHVKRYQGKGTFVAGPEGTVQFSDSSAITVGMVWRGTETLTAGEAIAAGLEMFYSKNAMGLLNLTHDDPFREMEVLEHLNKRGVDGILLETCTLSKVRSTARKQMEKMGLGRVMPIVYVGEPTNYVQGTTVWFDEAEAGRLATQHLIDQGHKRIAYIDYNLPQCQSSRLTGFRRAMEEAGLEVSENYILDICNVPHSDMSIGMGRNAAKIFLAQPQPPTAIAVYYDEVAAGVILEILGQGLKVPQDVAVIGESRVKDEFKRVLPISLSNVWFDLAEIVSRAAEELLAEINGAERGRQIRLPIEIRPKESTLGCGISSELSRSVR